MSPLIHRLQHGASAPEEPEAEPTYDPVAVAAPPPAAPPAPAYVPAHAPASAPPATQGPPLSSYLQEPKSTEATGLNPAIISDLVLKTLYYTSYLSGYDLSSAIRLPFYGILDQALASLKREELAEVTGTAGIGEAGYQWVLTRKGLDRADAAIRRSAYVGPAPVPLNKYIEMVLTVAQRKPRIDRTAVHNALTGMILTQDMTDKVGAAINAGKSLFLYGAPGNGKSMLAERIGRMMGGNICVPYAIEADGQIIQFFDLNLHRPIPTQTPSAADGPSLGGIADPRTAEYADHRWVQIQRPVVVVGGELTMESLDLIYHEQAGFYEAPFQLKANNGVFLIDDFGRQQMRPQQLLNRWIVPLEKAVDFLTLHTGKKLQVPFELFLVLSTNLDPAELVDEAFMRRIQNKLNMPDPTPEQYLNIFKSECQKQGVPFDESGLAYLIREHYIRVNRPLRAVHPRDLLRQLVGLARYQTMPPQLIPLLMDQSCNTYFVNALAKKA
ncbi:MAG TPA: ATP-binding protein [Chloroflexia bacterium]|nr:ATP-binding protein [Chloroflexia bacterium]